MEKILQKNIERYLAEERIKLAELARRTQVSYSTLQGIMKEESPADAQLSTINKLASGMGTTIGALIEEPKPVEQSDSAKNDAKSREALLVSLFQEALKLDDDALVTVLGFVEKKIALSNGKTMSGLEKKD